MSAPEWWTDSNQQIVSYNDDTDGCRIIATERAILGLGDYADEGEPDAVIDIWCPVGFESLRDHIRNALDSWGGVS